VRAIHWFRHDLRLRDNRSLSAAATAEELIPVFILDPKLLEGGRAGAPRTRFLLDSLSRLARDLEGKGSRLVLRRGDPEQEMARLFEETGAERLHLGTAHGPTGTARDGRIRALAGRSGVSVTEHKDHVVFESREVLSSQGRPYAVYTPYRKAWRKAFDAEPQTPERAPRLPPVPKGLASEDLPEPPELDDGADLPTGGEDAAERRLRSFLERDVADYASRRDLPAEDATSRLSPYLRFGVISARRCIEAARGHADAEGRARDGVRAWIDELVWRDFYWAILAEHPRVAHESYRREFESVQWEDDEEGFQAWCEGRTGYPIVDAGMRQLRQTGWMHNRVRMIVASFLTKDLLVDWRRGEDHFYKALVDGDPASNNGGWQWAASTGTDAQPFFRIFNPVSQGRRFDPEGRYVRRWVTELEGVPTDHVHAPWEASEAPRDYPAPIVDHAERRKLALERYEAAREEGSGS